MLQRKKISELIEENYVFASVLYYFGIKFYDYSEDTLEHVCIKKKLNVQTVVRDLENINYKGISHKNVLFQLPAELIVEYLKHAHHIFIKKRLPYIAKLIEELTPEDGPKDLIQDLKWIFPVFVEDFIHHAYQEEDTLFNYIKRLEDASKGKIYFGKMFFEIKNSCLRGFAIEHEEHEEELQGIRKITNEYSISNEFNQHLKVVYYELLRLEEEFVTHASIENEILFPRGLQLERELLHKFSEISVSN